MTDPAHLQAALERLRTLAGTLDSDEPVTFRADAADLRLFLIHHAALTARAEAAEAALVQVGMTVHASDDAEATLSFLASQVSTYFAAHPQPQAPVMGGEGERG